jgi:hypothetical protein
MNQLHTTLICKAHDYEGVALDVYAQPDDDGLPELAAVTLAGDKRDLFPLLSDAQIDYFDALISATLKAERSRSAVDRALDAVGGKLQGMCHV